MTIQRNFCGTDKNKEKEDKVQLFVIPPCPPSDTDTPPIPHRSVNRLMRQRTSPPSLRSVP